MKFSSRPAFWLLIAGSLLITTHLPAQAQEWVYLSSGGNISVYELAPETGALDFKQSVTLPGAGPLVFSPGKELLYAKGSRENIPLIITYRVGLDGTLTAAGMAKVNHSPGALSIDPTGNRLASNHYKAGKASIWTLTDGIYRGEKAQEIDLAEKAHCAVFGPHNLNLLVAATGPNMIFQIPLDKKTGAAKTNLITTVDGPQGEDDPKHPRHLVFHPRLPYVFTTLESGPPGVAIWDWNIRTGQLNFIDAIVSQAKESNANKISTSTLHIGPDGKMLYVALRHGEKDASIPNESAIIGYDIDPVTGKLTEFGRFLCEKIPRSFCLSATGSHVLVAGQGDDKLGVYKRLKTGHLEKQNQIETGARPNWVMTLKN